MKTKFLRIAISLLFVLSLFTIGGCSIFGESESSKNSPISLHGLTAKVSNENIYYDGTEKKPDIYLYDGEKLVVTVSANGTEDLYVEYLSNINAGEAEADVMAKDESKKFKGHIYVYFNILPQTSVVVDDSQSLIEYAASGNYTEIKLGKNITISPNERLTVKNGTTITLEDNTLELYGYMNVYGTVKFGNNSSLYMHGTIDIIGGRFTADKEGSVIYTDKDFVSSNVSDKIVIYRRSPISVLLENSSFEYNGEPICPEIITDYPESEYSIRYENNVDVGNGIVIVSARHDSEIIFGEQKINFAIKAVEKVAKDDATLEEILGNKNNTKVLLDGDFTTITVPEGCDFRSVNVTAQNVIVHGRLTVAPGTVFTSDCIVVNGYLKNEGNIAAGALINNGETVCGGTLKINASVQNTGNLTNNMLSTLDIQGEFINEKTGNLLNAGTAFFDGDITSIGQFVNNGTAYLTGTNFSVSNRIENAGQIITDQSVDFFFTGYKGKHFVRKPALSDWISLTEASMRYTGYDVKPVILFSKDGPTVVDTDYDKSRSYIGSNVNVYETKYPGEVNYKIDFKRTSKSYTGSLILSYTIQRGVYEITEKNKTTADPDVAFGNEYYEAVLISCEYDTSKNLSVPEYSELWIGESGKLNYKGSLTIAGKLINNGEFALPYSEQIILTADGKVINNGNIYTNGASYEEVITGEGQIFVRKPITNACIQGLPETVEFNSLYGVTPPFVVIVDGETIDSENYYGKYNGNNALGTASITVTARHFSPLIYGEAHATYRIVQGEIVVTSYSQLTDALKKGSVFHTVKLGCNINKSIGQITYTETEIVTIQSGVTLDCGEYFMNLTVIEGRRGNFKLSNSGTLKMQKYFDYGKHEGNGKVIGYTNNVSDLAKLVHCCHEVHLTGNITDMQNKCEIVLTNSAGSNQTKFNSVIVDLEGYTINAKVSVSLDGKNLTIKSNNEKGKGTIKASGWQYAFEVTRVTSGTTLHLNNLIIEKHYYASVGGNISATDCIYK